MKMMYTYLVKKILHVKKNETDKCRKKYIECGKSGKGNKKLVI